MQLLDIIEWFNQPLAFKKKVFFALHCMTLNYTFFQSLTDLKEHCSEKLRISLCWC